MTLAFICEISPEHEFNETANKANYTTVLNHADDFINVTENSVSITVTDSVSSMTEKDDYKSFDLLAHEIHRPFTRNLTDNKYSGNVSLDNEQLNATKVDIINVTSQSNTINESVRERNYLLRNDTSPVPFLNVIDTILTTHQIFARNSTPSSTSTTDDYINVTVQPNTLSVTNYAPLSNSTSSDYAGSDPKEPSTYNDTDPVIIYTTLPHLSTSGSLMKSSKSSEINVTVQSDVVKVNVYTNLQHYTLQSNSRSSDYNVSTPNEPRKFNYTDHVKTYSTVSHLSTFESFINVTDPPENRNVTNHISADNYNVSLLDSKYTNHMNNITGESDNNGAISIASPKLALDIVLSLADILINESEPADTRRVTNNTNATNHDTRNYKSIYNDDSDANKTDSFLTLENITTSSTQSVTHYSISNNLPITSNITNASTHSLSTTDLLIAKDNNTIPNYDVTIPSNLNTINSNENELKVTTETVDGINANNIGKYLSTTEKYNIITIENRHTKEIKNNDNINDTTDPNNYSNVNAQKEKNLNKINSSTKLTELITKYGNNSARKTQTVIDHTPKPKLKKGKILMDFFVHGAKAQNKEYTVHFVRHKDAKITTHSDVDNTSDKHFITVPKQKTILTQQYFENFAIYTISFLCGCIVTMIFFCFIKKRNRISRGNT